MIRNLETQKAILLEEISKLRNDIETGKTSKEDGERKLAQINEELHKVNDKIADKMSKLKIAQKQLTVVENKTTEAETKYSNVSEQLNSDSPTLNKKVLHEMQSMGYLLVALDAQDKIRRYNKIRDTLSSDNKDFLDNTIGGLFNDSIIDQIADSSSEIASIATALFLGYLDKATAISESHGGGGSPGIGWGKKDDEDELAFRRRCFFTAMHMMQPAPKRRRKR